MVAWLKKGGLVSPLNFVCQMEIAAKIKTRSEDYSVVCQFLLLTDSYISHLLAGSEHHNNGVYLLVIFGSWVSQ